MLERIESLLRECKWDEAIFEANQMVQLHPTNAKAQGYLGLAYFRKGAYKEAIGPLERAVSLDPMYVDAGLKLAQSYDRACRYHDACVVAKEFLKIQPNQHMLQGILDRLDRYEYVDKDGWEKGRPVEQHHVILTHHD